MERHVRYGDSIYGDSIARTGTGNSYDQSSEILDARTRAKKGNPNAIVLNPALAARSSVLYNGQRDYGYTTNDTHMYQPGYEKDANKASEWNDLSPDQKFSRQNRKNVNRATLQRTTTSSSKCNDSPSGCIIGGGKIAKKTKRKRSRRTKKSRRHRKK